MSDSSTIHSLQIIFETLSVPPPYSYRYTFNLQFTEKALEVEYELQYTDRDELTEEEIWEEGFSNADDFSWKGQLPHVWNSTLKEAWQQTRLTPEDKLTASLENGLVMTAELSNEQQISGVPEKIQDWEYLLQELTQAVYEVAQREYPLRIRFLERSAQGEEVQLTIDIQFLHRSLAIVHQQEKKSQRREHPWPESRRLLSMLYQLDFNAEHALTKMPRQPGKYLDPGDGLWYELGKDITNPGKEDYIAKVIDFLTGK